MSQENSDKSVPTISPETGDADPPTVSSEQVNAGYEYYEETGPPRESAVLYYDEENFSEEQTKPSSTDSQLAAPTPSNRDSGSVPAAPMEVNTTAHHTGEDSTSNHSLTPIYDVMEDQKKQGVRGKMEQIPCSFLCIAGTALTLSILSLIIAVIPIIAFCAQNESPSTTSPSEEGAARRLLSDGLVINREIHRLTVHSTRPNVSYHVEPAVLDSDRFDGYRQTLYVGGYWGWTYMWWYDFIENEQDYDGRVLYPLSDIHTKLGDRLVFRSYAHWARDPVLLVPRDLWESCNFSHSEYSDYYLDDAGKLITDSPFYLAAPQSLYNNLSDPKWLANHSTDWHSEWNEFVWTIEDHSHLLPCNESDLYCQLVTDDVLYFVSPTNWNVWWGKSCSGSWETSVGGLQLRVYIDGVSHEPLEKVEVDPNALLDVETVRDLEYAIGSLGRTLILSQFTEEQRVRSEHHSGISNVRGLYDGDDYYDDGTYSNGAAAAIHDHADYLHVVGMGEVEAVLNGVAFGSRHNDYNLNMPSTTSNEYGATEPIAFPEVPPAVIGKESVDEQMEEMQEWFRAFKAQNASHRNYTEFFRPILCYLEGTWILDDDDIEEPFQSDRTAFGTAKWQQLSDQMRWMANSGRKDVDEELAHLPSALRNLENDTFPIVSNWEYRILCHPLAHDVALDRLRVADDLSVQMMDAPKSRADLEASRRARYQLSTYIDVSDPDGAHQWVSGRKRWNYLDYLMEQIPGKDNYGANITDELPDGSQTVIQYNTDEVVNAGYYTRFYGLDGTDAMGSSKHRRGWADRYLFAAKTTQQKVSPISFDYEMEDESGESIYHHTVSRWSYAIPLEIIYLTPLTRWNPYNISKVDTADFDDTRSGGCSVDDAFDGWTTSNAYFTPSAFYSGNVTALPGDTVQGPLCALDGEGTMRSVMASGHWIHFPEIGNGVGSVRQRYPIFPVADDGLPSWKEVKALENVFLDDDYDDPVDGAEAFADSR